MQILGLSIIFVIVCVLVLPVLPYIIRRLASSGPHLSAPPAKVRSNNNEISKWWFKQFLELAKSNYNIVSGNLYGKVYDSELSECLRKRLKDNPKLKVRILVGPTIACEGRPKNHALWGLYQSGEFGRQFEIRILDDIPAEHYRIADSNALYLEGGHGESEEKRSYRILAPSCKNAYLYRREFDRAWAIVKPDKTPVFRHIGSNLSN
jgi:hypothetical protein